MKKFFIPFVSILFIVQGCNDTGNDLSGKNSSALYGKEYTLIVNRIADSPDVQFPTDNLKETDYTAFHEQKNYTISVSENGNQIAIEPGSLKGERVSSTGSKIVYNLTEGAFAGGRVVIWSVNKELEAELTLYGSGNPILSSERGKLFKD
jgi:hypothetical protein